MRRYPRDNPEILRGKRTGCPPSVLSCTTWGFSCLADYSASGELLPRLFTLTSASLPKNRRFVFCDTFRHCALSSAMPASFTRHAAVWCSDFPLQITPERSPAINRQLSTKPAAFYRHRVCGRNSKFETRNPNSYQNLEGTNVRAAQPAKFRFRPCVDSNLFRISISEFRIFPSQGFWSC